MKRLFPIILLATVLSATFALSAGEVSANNAASGANGGRKAFGIGSSGGQPHAAAGQSNQEYESAPAVPRRRVSTGRHHLVARGSEPLAVSQPPPKARVQDNHHRLHHGPARIPRGRNAAGTHFRARNTLDVLGQALDLVATAKKNTKRQQRFRHRENTSLVPLSKVRHLLALDTDAHNKIKGLVEQLGRLADTGVMPSNLSIADVHYEKHSRSLVLNCEGLFARAGTAGQFDAARKRLVRELESLVYGDRP